MEHLPENIYLTTVGDTVFLCIESSHMWPVNSIKHVDMQLNASSTFVQFDGNQSWTFKGPDSETLRALLSKTHRESVSLTKRMAGE
jgi:hypothetical protein